MNWATANDAVQAWFATATGITCIWADQAVPRPAYPYGLLNVISDNDIGRDETQYTFDGGEPAGADMIPTICGNRIFTVSCQVLNAPSGNDSLGHNAKAPYYLGLARTSLGNQAALDALAVANVAYLSKEPTVNLNEVANGIWISRASMDVRFGTVENLVVTGDAISYINSTKISGDFTGTKDATIMDFTDEEYGG